MVSTNHGSARWLGFWEAKDAGLHTTDGILLGVDREQPDHGKWVTVGYTGEQHLFTAAPNRTGKGACAIVPNLLNYRGGVFAIDVKGELAIITANTRRRMGQNVQILDPWGIAVDRLRDECGFDGSDPARPSFARAGFNPLDMLAADSPNLSDDAMMIAEAHIMSEQGGDSHWSTEAKAAFAGFVGHVVTAPDEEGQRHLPRVRDILSLPPSDLLDLIERMAKSPHPFVRGSANRLMQKSEKELQSVMSTAAANTHFLDSPAIRATLTRSTFDFGNLKDDASPLTVYLVLPADRLNTHGRWLRLLVSMALTAVARRKGKPKISALFILDEFAALGRLAMVEQAVGLMAGFGLRIWAILQDFSQLQDLYQKRWQTFLANAGVVQIFGTNDLLTAEYISRLLGKQTLETVSMLTIEKRQGGFLRAPQPDYFSMNDREFGRDLLTVDEVMKLDEGLQILCFSGLLPVWCLRYPYYHNSRFFDWNEEEIWIPTYTEHPDFPKYDPDGAGTLDCDDETHERIARKRAEWAAREKTAKRAKKGKWWPF